jgi:transcriptional regulator with XRE-family HTH domain
MDSEPTEQEACERRFVRLLALVREARGLLQTDVAERLGKSRSVVAFVENRNRQLKPDEFPLWAEALGVEVDDITTLRMLSYGYRLRDGEWVFWRDWEDPEAYLYDAEDPEEVHFGPVNDIAALVNKMSGWEVCEHNYRDWSDAGELTLNFPKSRQSAGFIVSLPKTPLLGDPNEPALVHVQGTREDLDALLEESTAEQISLTAAFIRGLHAQARSRLRTH